MLVFATVVVDSQERRSVFWPPRSGRPSVQSKREGEAVDEVYSVEIVSICRLDRPSWLPGLKNWLSEWVPLKVFRPTSHRKDLTVRTLLLTYRLTQDNILMPFDEAQRQNLSQGSDALPKKELAATKNVTHA